MINCEVVILEDDVEYAIISKIEHNNETYIYLINENNVKDFCIRKLSKEEGKEFIIPLESDEEFDLALKLFKELNI